MGVTALGVRAGVEIGVVVEVWQIIRHSQNAKLVIEHNRPYRMACRSSKVMLSSMTLIDSPHNAYHLAALWVSQWWHNTHMYNNAACCLLLSQIAVLLCVTFLWQVPAYEPDCIYTLCHKLVTCGVATLLNWLSYWLRRYARHTWGCFKVYMEVHLETA